MDFHFIVMDTGLGEGFNPARGEKFPAKFTALVDCGNGPLDENVHRHLSGVI
jgi:hypothetical protein